MQENNLPVFFNKIFKETFRRSYWITEIKQKITKNASHLKGPQEIGSIFEMLANSEDLMDQIFSTDNVSVTKFIFNDLIAGNWYTLSFQFSKATFVNQFSHTFQVWITPGDIWLANTEHVNGGLVKFNKHTIVNLSETEQLQNFTNFRCYLVDTKKVK